MISYLQIENLTKSFGGLVLLENTSRGVAEGPEVARILRAVEARWIDEGFPDRHRVEQLLDEELPR